MEQVILGGRLTGEGAEYLQEPLRRKLISRLSLQCSHRQSAAAKQKPAAACGRLSRFNQGAQ
jgi:hypothetical protein